MKSPFPGMDPYLEQHWEDVHQTLAVYTRDAVQPSLPDDLWARTEERVYVEAEADRMRQIIPDAHIARIYPEHRAAGEVLRDSSSMVAEPIEFELIEPTVAEGYVVICERTGGKVVTVIEFLSLANKSGGTGQEKYLEKQAEVLRSDSTLVEIDLLRGGRRVLALPYNRIPDEHRNSYLACISPGWRRQRRELYPMPLRLRLPVLPIPLRRHEARIHLDLQALIDRAYTNGRYDRLDYSVPLSPPLLSDDAGWAAEKLGGTSAK